MKYVYQIKERMFFNEDREKTMFGGIAFYGSKKKAMEDFNNRFRFKDNQEIINEEEYGNECYTKIKEVKNEYGIHYEVIVEKHIVY